MEAFAAILAADRDTTLPELLAETAALPDNVVAVLVGEAFNRLDPLAQQVMQALAVFGVPVPAVAVDYLLQPYRAAVDAAPVLARLVNTQFVRRDAGRYYLHPVDRDYARQRISAGDPDDRDAAPPPFTQAALLHRAADYFAQTRTPRETWKTLDDLASQLAEFDLRCQAGDYDEAVQVLLDIDFDYLNRWGHYRLTLGLHRRLHGHLSDRWTHAAHLTNLGNCYADLGQTSDAIDHYRQALAIDREIGYRQGEANALDNLGGCYARLGQTAVAIEHYRQALAIHREIGYRRGEAHQRLNLGEAYADQVDRVTSVRYLREAVQLADDIGYVRVQSERAGSPPAGGLMACFWCGPAQPRGGRGRCWLRLPAVARPGAVGARHCRAPAGRPRRRAAVNACRACGST